MPRLGGFARQGFRRLALGGIMLASLGLIPTPAAASTSAPAITALSRNAGSVNGGYPVTITGSGLVGAVVNAPNGSVSDLTAVSDSSLTFIMPAEPLGTFALSVTNAYGTSPFTAAAQFTFKPAPTVTSVSPVFSVLAGGATITITGTRLDSVNSVSVGGAPVTSFTAQSATSISFIAPAHSAGTVDITATSPNGGMSDLTVADQITYTAAPVVTGLSVPASPTAGGVSLTLTGLNLTGATVHVGATGVASFSANTSTLITFLTPAGSEGATVDVTATTGAGTSALTAADQLVYTDFPFISAFSPATGSTAGGTAVTITGANLAGATSVQFSGIDATILTNTPNAITVTAPAVGAGNMLISLTATA